MVSDIINEEKQPGLKKRYLPLILGLFTLVILYLTSLYSYVLFHSLVEIFSVVIALGIFAVVWNARRFLENNYLLFTGITLLFSKTSSESFQFTLPRKLGEELLKYFEVNKWVLRGALALLYLLPPLLLRRGG